MCSSDLNAQSEQELKRLQRLPAELPALIQRPDPETRVNQGSAVKYDRNREKPPEQNVVMNTNGKRIQRNIAERMVEEMADQIGEQHQPAGETNLPGADAAKKFSELGPIKYGHVIAIM